MSQALLRWPRGARLLNREFDPASRKILAQIPGCEKKLQEKGSWRYP
jgi:hypothetical protein